MNNQQKRNELIAAHDNMRSHLYRMIDGLTQELLQKKISDEENSPDILSIIMHIGGAETYCFHKTNHDIAPKFTIEKCEDIHVKLVENTEGIRRVLETCPEDQLNIVLPSQDRGPSVAWCLLRTYQHGLYHTAQIAKIRHMISAPPIEEKPDTWSVAVDSVIDILCRFWND
ncbi:hypothetical protein EU527_08475 [Candidatus Thorarchaeota archaeon]|nr:MAG: hypothetical protein EU527_08475 [Candidatus Thorarchaeota archaeon]